MNYLILGLGISGSSARDWLLHQGHDVVCYDEDPAKSDGKVVWDEVERVIVSPGFRSDHFMIIEAMRRGLEVIGEAELALRELQNVCIGITGTNGKTTTVLLLEHVLKECGKKARALGNVGKSLSSYLFEKNSDDILVIELSSFQLERLTTRCLDFAAILNVTPDHLERYSSFKEYGLAKGRIWDCLKERGKRFVSLAMPHWLMKGKILENQPKAFAYAISKELGISDTEWEKAYKSFEKPKHRLEWVATIRGVKFYNDSKATNVDAVIHAVNQFDQRIWLIAGGRDKNGDFSQWNGPFLQKVHKIFLVGEAAETISKQVRVCEKEQSKTIEQALKRAFSEAEKGDVVLLSPGCASFDQFTNFQERGNQFKSLIRNLQFNYSKAGD